VRAVRFDEVPELEGYAEDLTALSVVDVRITSVRQDDESIRWLAIVVFAQRLTEPVQNGHLIWRMGLRPSRDAAAGAVVALLEGLVAGRRRAKEEFASSDDPEIPEVVLPLAIEAIDTVFQAWQKEVSVGGDLPPV
jgi:hypothetical protein